MVLRYKTQKAKSKESAGEIFTSTHEFLYLISVRASQIGRSLFYTMSLLSGEVGRQQTSGIRLQRLAVLAAVDQPVSRDTLKFMQGQDSFLQGPIGQRIPQS